MGPPKVSLEATITFDVGTRASTVTCACGQSHVCSGDTIGAAIGRAREREAKDASVAGELYDLRRHDIRQISLEVRGYSEEEMRGLVYTLVAGGYGAEEISRLTLAPVDHIDQLVADTDRRIFAAADAFLRNLEMPRLHRERLDLYRRAREVQARIDHLAGTR